MDSLLDKFNLKYEDLKPAEQETLHLMLSDLKKNELTVMSIREYITKMKMGVEEELTKVGHETRQDIYLKARLRNYILLEAFLVSPEQAQKEIEKALAGIPKVR